MSRFALAAFAAVFLFSSAQAATDLDLAKQRCAPQTESDLILYASDFKWGYEIQEMRDRFTEIYQSGKRLTKRAYYDPAADKFIFPYESLGNSHKIEIPGQFIESIALHAEEGLKRDYIDALFFPDMGHSHFFLPEAFYEEHIRPLPGNAKKARYELMMNHPGTKILYHTAEQLHMKDRDTKELVEDQYTQWRYYTRNLVGYNDGSGKVEIHKLLNEGFNTVRSYPEHKYWGAGFNVSASKDGCFSFQDKQGNTLFFDLSLEDLPFSAGPPSSGFFKADNGS